MGVTVKELLRLCIEQVAKGNGDKLIVLSNDDEGNGYHDMIYHFTEEVAENDMWGTIENPETKIILG